MVEIGKCKSKFQIFTHVWPPYFTHYIPFHFFLFFSTFLILQTIPFHSIFFQPFFSTFQIPTQYLKSQTFIPLRNSQSQTILHYFSKSFSNHSKPFFLSQKMGWNGQNIIPKQGVKLKQYWYEIVLP